MFSVIIKEMLSRLKTLSREYRVVRNSQIKTAWKWQRQGNRALIHNHLELGIIVHSTLLRWNMRYHDDIAVNPFS